MVNKELLVKGVSFMLYSFPFFFAGPMLMFYSEQQENLVLKIVSGFLMLLAMFLSVKGLFIVLESFFGKRKN
jgi:predicted membrane protein